MIAIATLITILQTNKLISAYDAELRIISVLYIKSIVADMMMAQFRAMHARVKNRSKIVVASTYKCSRMILVAQYFLR
jgi:hypothetical protein